MVIYKPDAGPLSVSQAIEYMRKALPKESAGEVLMRFKEDGTPDWDGPIEVRRNDDSDIRSAWLEADFLDVCTQLGIQPRNLYRPHLTDFSWDGASASYYTISHDEFVRYASLYHVDVQIRPEIPATENAQADVSSDAARRAEVEPSGDSSKAWLTLARDTAVKLIARDRARDLYPSQVNLAEEIAREFRKNGTVGPDGKPLSAATIKRHALKGISSAIGKQLSTAVTRGK